jgi:excisionase family DNA binding protein
MSQPSLPEYLTTRELAALLRITERKVYDLVASETVPCSRATGKLLFPRDAVQAWLARARSGPDPSTPLPGVVLGSHDPLLEWSLRESRCGLATFLDGSADGLERFTRREGVAAGLHLPGQGEDEWNVSEVSRRCAAMPVVLMHWAVRERGLILDATRGGTVDGLQDLPGLRIVPRQPGSGAQMAFDRALRAADVDASTLNFTQPARSEADAAVAVLENRADATFGLATLAARYRLRFVPVLRERFDLLVDRRSWFEPPMQTLLEFCRGDAFARRVGEMTGYDLAEFGQIRFNGG